MSVRIVMDHALRDSGLQKLVGAREAIVIAPGPEFITVRRIDDEEWDDISIALSFVSSLGTGAKLLDASVANYNEFVDAFNGYHLAGRSGVEEAVRVAFSDLINRRLSSYLSSMRMFLDYSEFRFKQFHSIHEDKIAAFSSLRSRLFDTNFAYRFAYKLRNYSQHFGFPVGDIAFSEQLVDGSVDEIASSAKVVFSTVELLAVGGDCWGPVRKDLREHPDGLDVGSVMKAVPPAISTLWAEILRIESDYIAGTRMLLENAFFDPQERPGTAIVGEWLDVGGHLGLRYDPMPVEVLKRLERECPPPSGAM